jgi:cobalt-precorrin-5B (C1)-methyltransferase
MARSGYTLPVFAVAAAKAALVHLQDRSQEIATVELDLLPDQVRISIAGCACLDDVSALAMTISDPGDNLDLTRYTPVWAQAKLIDRTEEPLILMAGAGLGRTITGEPAIYSYARKLFDANLLGLIPDDRSLVVTIILPEGKAIAQRTSNAAFGVLEGLSLLGTSGISQPLSTEEHLDSLRSQLLDRLSSHTDLTFCIGSNGMQVAQKLGIDPTTIVQTGNWIGAVLLHAAAHGATSVKLLGYQGKLVKLAGGIFNTSSHLADAKLEIIAAATVKCGGGLDLTQAILNATTADRAHALLMASGLAELVFTHLGSEIATRASNYVRKYANVELPITVILFDRQGQIITTF